MCGIAGFWVSGEETGARFAAIRAMTDSLWHRGPDEGDVYLSGDVALGIRRLRVVDPEGGSQPMPNEDGTIHVVFNGEIYNHADLRNELRSRGHRFRSRSDTEVIVHAYEEWGASCPERFNGMFAFAVWDSPRQRLLLARDRLGIKPLFLYETLDGVVFGSELKAVLTAPWVPAEWDLAAVDQFLTYEYVPGPRSILRGVRKLPPATTIQFFRDAAPVERRYWRLEPGVEYRSPSEAAEALRERLSVSVRRRLLADVPVGAFLSGGMDSSTLVAVASALGGPPLETFTLGFADASYDERQHAALAARHFATRHDECVVEPSVVDLAERLARYLDEPFGDVSTFPTYLVSSQARRSVTVALSGDGGDELFAGYDQYRAHRWAHRLRWVTRGWPWRAVETLLSAVPPSSRKKGAVNFAKRFTEGLRHPADLEHARWWVFAGAVQRRTLFSPDLRAALGDHDPLDHYRGRLAEGAAMGFQGLQRQLYADITGYLVDDILTKVDRMSMAVSLEARVPFLDHEVVETAMRIPAAWKLRQGDSKWILKQAFGGVLPPSIPRRRKQGFSMPMKNWLRGPLQPMLRELTSAERVRDRGWFEPAEVQRLVREHVGGTANHAHLLWCLMSLELSVDHLSGLARGRTPQQHKEVAV
jgi:asparagine synthase (glutamine-hydrolysing)